MGIRVFMVFRIIRGIFPVTAAVILISDRTIWGISSKKIAKKVSALPQADEL